MIAYRAELWCNGCSARFGKGTPHDNESQLPGLAKNLVELATHGGKWIEDGDAHWCPDCQVQRATSLEAVAPGAPPGKAKRGSR